MLCAKLKNQQQKNVDKLIIKIKYTIIYVLYLTRAYDREFNFF